MLRAILVISLAVAVGARKIDHIISSDPVPGEPDNLGWLFEPKEDQGEKTESTEIDSERSVCRTKECQSFAKKLQESMNTSADPCEDFHEYVCGNWAEHNKPPTDDTQWWSMLFQLVTKISKELKEMLTVPAKRGDDLPVKVLKKWYSTCMNTAAADKKGIEPIVSTMARIGGWPLAMEKEIWNEDVFKWQVVDDYYARLTGINSLHSVGITPYAMVDEKLLFLLELGLPEFPPRTDDLYQELHRNDGDDDEEECEETSDKDKDDDDDDDDNDEDDDDNDENDDDNDNDGGDSENENDNESDNDNSENQSEDTDDGSDNNSNNDDDEENDSDTAMSENSDERKMRLAKSKKVQKRHKIQHEKHATKKMAVKRKTKWTSHKNKMNSVQKKSDHVKHRKISQHMKKMVHKALNKRVKRSLLSNAIHHQVKYHVRDAHKHKLSKLNRSWKRQQLDKTDSDEMTTEATTNEDEEDEDENENDDNDDEDSEEEVLPLLKAYYKYMTEVALAIIKESGSDVDLDDLHADIKDVILFQMELQGLAKYNDHKNMTLSSFQKWYNNLKNHDSKTKANWEDKVIHLFAEGNADIDPDQWVIANKAYFKRLNKLIENTPSRTIVNYIHWHFLSTFIQATTKEMRDLYNSWQERDTDGDNRHAECLPDGRMEELVSYQFVKQRFTTEKMQMASDILDDIQKELEYQMKDSEWMDDETRDFVLTKLIHMRKTIGYPEWYNNDTLVKQHLRGLTVGSSYFENLMNYGRFKKWEELRQLANGDLETLSRTEMSPTIVNAAFDSTANKLIITAADFESPLFSLDRPNTLNFAILGSIMSHEVNHGFDYYDHHRDKHGTKQQWLTAMAKAYKTRAQCFIKQYDDYIEEMGLTEHAENFGNQTLDENIADTMGVYTVYKAFKRRQRECGSVDDALPGFENFSEDQMFFLAYGYVWCDSMAEGFLEKILRYSSHSFGRLRLIGPISNSEDFAKAFNCPVGSPMNPEHKCNIWK